MSYSFSEYLFHNFAFFINTPLCGILINFISFIWKNKSPDIMEHIPSENHKNFVHDIYSKKNNNNHINRYTINLNKDIKIKLNKLIDEIKNDHEIPNVANFNNFSEELFEYVMKNVIMYKVTKKYDALENNLNEYDYHAQNSNMPKEIYDLFDKYFCKILMNMTNNEKYIDQEKIDFIRNYRLMIYDNTYTKQSIENTIYYRVDQFKINIKNKNKKLNQMINVYNKLITKWIHLYDNNIYVSREYIYPSYVNYEQNSIYHDICTEGEISFIEIVSPNINKMNESVKKDILGKMSSGASKKTKYLFYSIDKINDISKDVHQLFNSFVKDKKIQKIDFSNVKSKEEFSNKIKLIAENAYQIITT